MPKNVYNLCKNLCNTACKTGGNFRTFFKRPQKYFINLCKTLSFSQFFTTFPMAFAQFFDYCFSTIFSTFYTRPITIITNIFNNKVEEE